MKTHAVFAIVTVILFLIVTSRGPRNAFTFEDVIRRAQNLAEEPYEPIPAVSSEALRKLSYDQFRDIRWKDQYTLWRKLGLPFQAKFFITGFIHSEPVTIYQVTPESVRPLHFAPEFFDYGRLNSIPYADQQKGGFSGFRMYYPINKPDVLDEVFVALGASYFRSLGKAQVYGISARGIAINTGSAKEKEEFPSFTTFWLVRPGNLDKAVSVYALLDGPSVTGAYQFHIQPGVSTIIDVQARVFFRKETKLLGIAPLTSMYWYGENTSNTFGGWRPEVHDSDGLLIHNGAKEWLWRPLAWSKQMQSNDFQLTKLSGFGLLQRDRDFSHYQDLEAHYHERPSVWIEPQGDWGKGSLRLLQFATNNEYADNVVAFWKPDRVFQRGDRMDFAYRMSWRSNNPDESGLARCIATRIDYQDQEFYRIFVLDFSGDALGKLPPETKLNADVWSDNGSVVDKVVVQKNTNDNSWRLSFTVSTKTPNQPHELRCSLKNGDAPATETWTYTWMSDEHK